MIQVIAFPTDGGTKKTEKMDARETEAAITRLQFATNKREAELTS
jgi:hypothetical protein